VIKVRDKSRLLRRLVRISLAGAAVSFFASAIPNLVIAKGYDRYIYQDVQHVPPNDVALVLGTSKYINGRLNPYYQGRVDAALALYRAGKVSRILVSGDNSRLDYDEPLAFEQDLIRLGVPESAITLDRAGLRTLDSIVRARETFGLTRFVVVSQRFHCERALFIAHSKGLRAIGFAAREVMHPVRYRVMVREYLARVKAGIDIWLIDEQPRYLGKTTLGMEAAGQQTGLLWLTKRLSWLPEIRSRSRRHTGAFSVCFPTRRSRSRGSRPPLA
jgi:SanA protein